MANKGVNYKRYKQAGWVLAVMTVAGTLAGLAVMHPIEQEECIPRGYGRQRTQSPIRSSDGLPRGNREEGWL